MQIKASSWDKAKQKQVGVSIWIPVGFLTCRIAIALINRQMKKRGKRHDCITLRNRDLWRLTREARRLKRLHGKFELVTVESADGDAVRIFL